MITTVEMRQSPPTRIRLFRGGMVLATFVWPQLLGMASAAAFQNHLATWEGRVQKVTRDGLQATLDTGEASIRLSQGASGLRNGFTTSVLVTGSDRVTVLKTGVHVRFECDLNEQGEPVGPILKIEARDEPFAEEGIFPAANSEVPALAAARESGKEPTTARVEIVGELRRVDLGRRSIDVWYPKDNMPTTHRGPFPIDPEATRVDFAFLDLAQAKPNDQVFVRGFMSDDDASIVAAEIRIRRVDVFPAEEADGVRLDPLAAVPGLGMTDDAPMAETAATADTDPANTLAAQEVTPPGEMAQEDSGIPPELAATPEVEVIEFPKNAIPKTAEEKARRHYKIN